MIHTPAEMLPAAEATAPIEKRTRTGVPEAIQNACVQFSVRCILCDCTGMSPADAMDASAISPLLPIFSCLSPTRFDASKYETAPQGEGDHKSGDRKLPGELFIALNDLMQMSLVARGHWRERGGCSLCSGFFCAAIAIVVRNRRLCESGARRAIANWLPHKLFHEKVCDQSFRCVAVRYCIDVATDALARFRGERPKRAALHVSDRHTGRQKTNADTEYSETLCFF